MSKTVGDVLVEQGLIDSVTLQSAATEAQSRGMPVTRALVASGRLTEAQIVWAVASHLGMPFADLTPGKIDPEAAVLLPHDLAVELCALPVAFGDDGGLVVAVAEPTNTVAVERVAALTNMAVTPALAARGDLLKAIEHLADRTPVTMPDAAVTEDDVLVEDDPTLLAFEQEQRFDLNEILLKMVAAGGSDLHLTAGVPPTIRVHGDLEPLPGFDTMGPADLQKMIYGILTQRQREVFENELELDVSYAIPNASRFRVNVFQQRDAMGAVMRVIPYEIKSIEQLGVPAQVTNFAYMPRGFVLVTGPTGSGKSTTLASLIDVINRERACHIMTVEDPIEFLHQHKRSLVNQRELGTDTHSFAQALKHVLRQDPDVILVGEMRDLETIQVALTAAETGHLVFGTLHTQDAPQTIDRVIDVFPPHQQEQIRVMLSGALQGVVCQQLLKTVDGQGRVVACEVMMATPAIRNLIREGKTHQMMSSLQAGKQHGMVTMDSSLAQLVLTGKVTYDAALEKCANVADFNRLCGRA